MKKLYFFNILLSVLLVFAVGCNSDDDANFSSEQFVTANVNGVQFNSDEKMAPLGFTRILMPSGSINLHAKALSVDGSIMELWIENYQGQGKYYFGDNYYNKSWVKFESSGGSESWSIQPGGALNRDSNFIEISSVKDNYIEGKIGCRELINSLNGILGALDGEFRLVVRE